MRRIITILALVAGAPAFGLSIYNKALDVKANHYITQGVVLGGEAGPGFTLLNIRRQNSPKLGLERVILDIGSRDGKPLLKKLGYFHVSVEQNPARVVIDLMQTSQSRVNEAALARMFSKSPFVKTVQMVMEPEDGSAKIVLNTRMPVAAEVFRLTSEKKPSRIVVDLKKASL
jgi:hypothetical protein